MRLFLLLAVAGCTSGEQTKAIEQAEACRREVAEMMNLLHAQEYALQTPDLIHGGVTTWAVFHGQHATEECGVALKSVSKDLPAFCKKVSP